MRGEKLESENPTKLCREIGVSRASGRTFRGLETAPTGGVVVFVGASPGLTGGVSFGHLIAAWRPRLRGVAVFVGRCLRADRWGFLRAFDRGLETAPTGCGGIRGAVSPG